MYFWCDLNKQIFFFSEKKFFFLVTWVQKVTVLEQIFFFNFLRFIRVDHLKINKIIFKNICFGHKLGKLAVI